MRLPPLLQLPPPHPQQAAPPLRRQVGRRGRPPTQGLPQGAQEGQEKGTVQGDTLNLTIALFFDSLKFHGNVIQKGFTPFRLRESLLEADAKTMRTICFVGQQVPGHRGRRRHHEGHIPAAAAVDGAADPPRPAAGAAQDRTRSRR